MSTYIEFESDHFVVGRLRRQTASRSDAFGVGRLVVGPLRDRTPSASRLRRQFLNFIDGFVEIIDEFIKSSIIL